MKPLRQSTVIQEVIEQPAEELIGYGLRLMGLPSYRYTGKGVRIAILDTGVDETHPDIAPNFAGQVDPWPGMSLHPHGTHVASIAAAPKTGNGMIGVAPDAKIRSYRVLDFQGWGTPEGVTAAIRQAVEDDCDVINMSLGWPLTGKWAISETDKAKMAQAIDYAESKGVPCVVSFGNEGAKGGSWPGVYAKVIAVAAVDELMQATSFTSIGDQVDIAAAGKDVYAAIPGGKWAKMSGTSMGAPHIAGAIARIIEWYRVMLGRKPSVQEIREFLYLHAIDLDLPGTDPRTGVGLFTFNPLEVTEQIRYLSRVIELIIGDKRALVDGREYVLDVAPFIQDGRTVVPLRFVAEAMGFEVAWEASARKIIIKSL